MLEGQRVAESAVRYLMARYGEKVEQDRQDWLRQVLAALQEFAGKGVGRAICLTSQVSVYVFADDAWNVLRPAITWQTGPADRARAEIDARLTRLN